MKMNRKQLRIILAVTFGNILEWYQAYAYIYLAPVLAKLFFNFHSKNADLLLAFVIFGIGFITRPIGGFIFGRWGDLLGRKSAFVWSIVIITIPTFLMGSLPTYEAWGIWAAISLLGLRLVQSISECGDAPGSFCFLYENATQGNTKFMTSWGSVGNQIGALIAIFEALFLDQYMSESFLLAWGWRIMFWVGSGLGLFGLLLRETLDETPTFKNLVKHHHVDAEKFISIIKKYKGPIFLGTSYGAINAVTFYLIATFLPSYFHETSGLDDHVNALVSITILLFSTILLPIFGYFGEKYSIKLMMIWSAISIIFLTAIMYCLMYFNHIYIFLAVTYLYIIPITCISAFIPILLLHLFIAPVRFTGVGIAFNLADGVIGGFTPAIAITLALYTKIPSNFLIFVFLCSLISLIAYFKIRD